MTSKCVVLSLHGNEMIALCLGAGIFVSTSWGEPFNAVTHVLGNLAVVAFLSSSSVTRSLDTQYLLLP